MVRWLSGNQGFLLERWTLTLSYFSNNLIKTYNDNNFFYWCFSLSYLLFVQVQVSFSWLFCYLQVFGEIYSSQLLTRQCNSSSEKNKKTKMRTNPSNKRTKSLGHHATAIESCQDLRSVQLTVFWNKNEWNEVDQILPHKRFATILLGIPILDTINWTDP